MGVFGWIAVFGSESVSPSSGHQTWGLAPLYIIEVRRNIIYSQSLKSTDQKLLDIC